MPIMETSVGKVTPAEELARTSADSSYSTRNSEELHRSLFKASSSPGASPLSTSIPLPTRPHSPARHAHARHPAAGPLPRIVTSLLHRTSISSSSDRVDSPQLTTFCVTRVQAEPFPPVQLLPSRERKRILVTGGAGFVGSHLVDRLMQMGHDVLVLDNFFTGQKSNLSHWIGHPNFEMVRHDVVNPIMMEVDQIYHLACPASPPHYQANQIKTIKTNFLGTSNMLGLAKRTKARFLLASTSEVYGDPEVSPQKETYNGNVNQTGPRACYDEGKRVAETLTYGYLYQDNVDVRVARIFNSYGPRMNPYDGRAMSNFLMQALKGESLTIYGDGSQTRSFCYIEDLIDGLIALMNSESSAATENTSAPINTLPVNLGSDNEFTIRELVEIITEVLDEISLGRQVPLAKYTFEFTSLPVDDPRQRRPDITRAKELLNWSPKWKLEDGIREMAQSYLKRMDEGEL